MLASVKEMDNLSSPKSQALLLLVWSYSWITASRWISQNYPPHPTPYPTLPMDVGNKRLQYRWKFKKPLVGLSLQPTWGTVSITQLFYGPLSWAHNTEPSEAGWTYLSLRVWYSSPRDLERQTGGEIRKPFPDMEEEWSQEAGWYPKAVLVPPSITFIFSTA